MSDKRTVASIVDALRKPITHGQDVIEITKSAWKRWHGMGYHDLQVLRADLEAAKEQGFLRVRQVEVSENRVTRGGRSIIRELHADNWKHVRVRLDQESFIIDCMLGMIYTHGWPLPAWEELASPQRDDIISQATKRRVGRPTRAIHDYADAILQILPNESDCDRYAVGDEDARRNIDPSFWQAVSDIARTSTAPDSIRKTVTGRMAGRFSTPYTVPDVRLWAIDFTEGNNSEQMT